MDVAGLCAARSPLSLWGDQTINIPNACKWSSEICIHQDNSLWVHWFVMVICSPPLFQQKSFPALQTHIVHFLSTTYNSSQGITFQAEEIITQPSPILRIPRRTRNNQFPLFLWPRERQHTFMKQLDCPRDTGFLKEPTTHFPSITFRPSESCVHKDISHVNPPTSQGWDPRGQLLYHRLTWSKLKISIILLVPSILTPF